MTEADEKRLKKIRDLVENNYVIQPREVLWLLDELHYCKQDDNEIQAAKAKCWDAYRLREREGKGSPGDQEAWTRYNNAMHALLAAERALYGLEDTVWQAKKQIFDEALKAQRDAADAAAAQRDACVHCGRGSKAEE